MIEVVLNDRLGKKVRVKCNEDDTIMDLKKLVAAQNGTRAEKIRISKWCTIYEDHITVKESIRSTGGIYTHEFRYVPHHMISNKDYEIHDGMGLELYFNWVSFCLLCPV